MASIIGVGSGLISIVLDLITVQCFSADQGNEIAKKGAGIVEAMLTPQQIAETQKLSSVLWEKYVVPFQ